MFKQKMLKINQYINVLSHIKHAAQLFSTLIIVRNVSRASNLKQSCVTLKSGVMATDSSALPSHE